MNDHIKNTQTMRTTKETKLRGMATTKAAMIRAREETRQTTLDTTERKWTV